MIKKGDLSNSLMYCLGLVMILFTVLQSCTKEDDTVDDSMGPVVQPTETDFTDLLTNQVDEVIIPTMEAYETSMNSFVSAVGDFISSTDQINLDAVRVAYQTAYLAYQAAAVHDYLTTSSQGLVVNTNLYPIDEVILANLIDNQSFNFNTTAQERANGFPAIDFMLYGASDVLNYFNSDNKRLTFLDALVKSMQVKAKSISDTWKGNLRISFIDSEEPTALNGAISLQLNGNIVYYEMHVRGNKVGIPIGRLAPGDSPFPADATKIEAYYQSLSDGNENFTLSLLRATIEEMEDLYLGRTSNGNDGMGYDDLLIAKGQSVVDNSIKAQFQDIYDKIDNRSSISGDDTLYLSIQEIVTLYKSDLLPLLNVQDADGANDGD